MRVKVLETDDRGRLKLSMQEPQRKTRQRRRLTISFNVSPSRPRASPGRFFLALPWRVDKTRISRLTYNGGIDFSSGYSHARN